jgi:aspartate carbamoyltransferase catalytic subunit
VNRHLLSSADLTRDDVETILATAESMHDVQKRDVKKIPTLRGRTIINLFFEDSTRTRSSFEIAGKWMSADTINITGKGSSASKGESLRDTVRTIDAMAVDALVIRHSASGACHQVAQWVDASVINAGDGTH